MEIWQVVVYVWLILMCIGTVCLVLGVVFDWDRLFEVGCGTVLMLLLIAMCCFMGLAIYDMVTSSA